MALYLFDKVLSPSAYTLPDNQEFSLALGTKTLVNWTSTQALTFVGLISTSTGGNVDGLVVCFSNLNNNSFTLTFAHESGLASVAANRCRNAGLSSVTGGTGAGAVWYRYHGTLARWIQIAKT